MSDLRLNLKGQLDLWCLYKTSVSLVLTFLASIIFFSLTKTVIEKCYFKIFSKFNALGIKFGLVEKEVNVNADTSFVQVW